MKLTQRIVLAGFILASLAGPAAREARAESIVPLTSERTGLVVYIGCGDAYFVRWARPHKGTIVHGLDTSARSVATVNEQIARLGVSGRMSAAVFDGKHLPYIDSVVNMLIAPKGHNVSRDEILRVLAPGGKAIVHQGDDPKMFTKPRPKTIGDWTHYLQGPGNNAVAQDTAVGPPRHMQWLAAPRWTRTHHGLNTVSAVVTAGGRIFSIIDSATPANKGVPGKWSIVARDAFNGVRLWTKKIDSWVIHPRFRSGPPQVTRLLVTGENRVYAPLGLGEPITVMDAATGKTLAVYSDTVGAEELILTGKTLLTLKSDGVPAHAAGHPKFKGKPAAPTTKTIVATNIATGKTLWQWTCEGGSPMPETLGSDGKRAFIQIGQGVACIDMTSGKVAWTYGPSKPTARGRSTAAKKAKPANGKPKPPRRRRPAPRMSFGKSTLVISDGVVLCNLSAGLTAISADKGEKLWVGDKGMGFHAPMDVFVINGVVWTGSHVRDSVAPPPVDDFSVGRDLKTGKVLKRNTIAVDLQTAGHHHRCYREKATVRYIITGKRGFEMMDMSGDEHSRNNWVRGTCQYGMMPANGLTYAPPHSCGCYMEAKLWGFWALAPASKAVADKQRIIPDAKRLTKGPAFGKINPQSAIRDPQSNWPQYRRDVRRSGVTATVVPAALKQLWKIDLGKKLTSPVVAGGKVIVAAVDAATVYALDEKTGKIAWRVTVGGRVDSAPAIHDGLVLFGCADGWVYCLRLTDGELAWRFLAARADIRTVAMEQVESLWPVHGSVLVLNGVAYCSAGRSTWLDNGIALYGLDPTTGEIVCKSNFTSKHPTLNEGKDRARPEHVSRNSQSTTDYKTFLASDRSRSFSMAAGSVNDVLTSDGTNVFLHHVKFNAKLQKQDTMSRHLFSTSGMLDGAENHRSHWVLGTGDFKDAGVAYSWIVNGGGWSPTIAVPTGLMMVYDDEAVWAAQRKGGGGSYYLSKKANTPFSPNEEFKPDFRPAAEAKQNVAKWKATLSVRPRALLKAGDRLYVGSAPTGLPGDDPHALYEGRTGGAIVVASASDGSEVSRYKLASPPVWDGMAAADGKLFVSTENGQLHCLGASE